MSTLLAWYSMLLAWEVQRVRIRGRGCKLSQCGMSPAAHRCVGAGKGARARMCQQGGRIASVSYSQDHMQVRWKFRAGLYGAVEQRQAKEAVCVGSVVAMLFDSVPVFLFRKFSRGNLGILTAKLEHSRRLNA